MYKENNPMLQRMKLMQALQKMNIFFFNTQSMTNIFTEYIPDIVFGEQKPLLSVILDLKEDIYS